MMSAGSAANAKMDRMMLERLWIGHIDIDIDDCNMLRRSGCRIESQHEEEHSDEIDDDAATAERLLLCSPLRISP